MANIELAKAYVTIVPSLTGAQQTITEELTGVSSTAGAQAGSDAGEAFNINFSSILKGVGGVVAGVTGALAAGVAAGTAALVNMTREGAAYSDEVLTMSTNTHIAADELQAYMYAAELVDVSVDTMTSSMARNVRSMSSAADGTGAMAEAYQTLGVAVTDADGNLRDSQDVYWELIDALGQVSDDTERDALSMQIFGRSAQDLNSLIAVGSEGMAEYAAQAEEAGAILSDDTLTAFGEFDDTMQQLDSGVDAAKNALGTVLLPVLTDLGSEGVDLLGQFTNGILEANGDMDQIAATIEGLIPQVMSIINQYLPTVIELGGSIISSLAQAILSNLGSILSTAGTVLMTLGEGIIAVLPTLAPIATELIVNLANFVIDNLGTILESAILIVISVAEGISSALPELIPAAIAAIYQIVETLTEPDSVTALLGAALDIMIALGEGLLNSIPVILENIPIIISNIIDSFGALGDELQMSASTWAYDMMQSFISGIQNMIGNVADAASNIASTISSYIGFSEPEKGPLSDFHTYAPDMIDLFTEGLEESTPELEAALATTLALPAVAAPAALEEGYLDETSGSNDGELVIPIYIGQEKLDTIMLKSSQMAQYRRGF